MRAIPAVPSRIISKNFEIIYPRIKKPYNKNLGPGLLETVYSLGQSQLGYKKKFGKHREDRVTEYTEGSQLFWFNYLGNKSPAFCVDQ